MTLELVVNILLFLFFGYSFIYVGATVPKSPSNELGAEQWPQAIIILLLIALAFNIARMVKEAKKSGRPFISGSFWQSLKAFFTGKLFFGMAIVIAMAFLLESLGFLATCFLFMVAYGFLLGQRKIWLLIVAAIAITVILYIGFAVFLDVMLPRGLVPFLRNFSLFVENIFS